MNDPQHILVLETDTFIMPHFHNIGAFCTGHRPLLTEEPYFWLGQESSASDFARDDYLDAESEPILNVRYVKISKDIETPFIPIENPQKYSDGYGTIKGIDLPDTEKKGLRNKSIDKFFNARIKVIKRAKGKEWKNKVNFFNSLKSNLQKSKLQPLPAFTNLGIFLDNYACPDDEDSIVARARLYAADNEFQITKFYYKDYTEECLKYFL